MPRWNGEIPTIDLTDDELLEARRQQFAIGKMMRNNRPEQKAIRNSRDRRRRSFKSIKCTVCAIRSTCEKRKRFNLMQCTNGFTSK